MKEIRTFDGFLNADDEHNVLKQNQYVRLINGRIGSTTDGTTSRLEGIKGNTLLTNSLPSGNNTCIGAIADEGDKYIVYFLYNSTGNHRIFLYHQPTDTFWTVMQDSALNFSLDNPIQAAIINGILYWTDDVNEPRRLNLMAAIYYFNGASPVATSWHWDSSYSFEEFTLIRKPVTFAPSVSKAYDSTFPNNFVSNGSFKFAFRYTYYDGEQSVLSPWSVTSRLNSLVENYNYLSVTLPFGEAIRESVRFVDLIVYVESFESTEGQAKYFLANSWDRETDSALFEQHNSGAVALTFSFYNNKLGEAIDSATAVTPFHYVPLKTKTLAILKNRLFLSNNLQGYDTPQGTSLAITLSSGTSTSLILPLNILQVQGRDADNNFNYLSMYAVYTTLGGQTGWFVFTATVAGDSAGFPDPLPLPVTPTTADVDFKGATENEVGITYLAGAYELLNVNSATTGTTVEIGGMADSDTKAIFKSLSSYRGGVVFYDKYLRKCGVVTNEALQVTVPARTYAGTSGLTTGINWTLGSGARPSEIPDWAYYYTVVLAKNQKTRFFLQGLDKTPCFVTKNTAGEYVFDDTVVTYDDNTTAGIGIDLTSLDKLNMGYTFTEGDMCVLTDTADNTVELPVVAQDGQYIVLAAKDMSLDEFIFEIYTPYKASTNEPFYEMGAMYTVSNPTLSTRAYSQTTGTIRADAYLIQRTFETTVYYGEAMSPIDRYYRQWYTDHGRINLVTKEGQQRLKTELVFSDTYVAGTQTNGLSAFSALNSDILPYEMGEVMKLQPTSKVEGEGNVLLAIGRNESLSLYIGEAQITDASGASAFFAKSSGVLGQVNALKGDYGTQHPESVVLLNGNVFWIDVRRGCFVEYSVNGLDDISKGQSGVFKFSRFSKEWCDKFLSLETSDFTTLGSRPFIFGGVDVFHGEILFSLPKLGTNPNGQLVDYPTVDYPYDILDYAAKSVVFKKDPARWMGEYSYPVEQYVSLGSELYAFKAGALYRMNQSGSLTLFGSSYKCSVAFPFNADNSIKEYQAAFLEASDAPEWTHFRSEYPYEQSTDLIASDWTLTEGQWKAALLRDRLSPNATGTYDQKLHTGEIMRNKAMLCLLQFNTSSPVWVRLAGITYNNSTIQ